MHPASLPWYDSLWLSSFRRAIHFMRTEHPARLAAFLQEFDKLRTPTDFSCKHIPAVLNDIEHQTLLSLTDTLSPTDGELHEMLCYGRKVIHDHPSLAAIHLRLAPLMSDWIGEEVEASYSFLILYHNLGILPPHLDAPDAKWTFNYCIRQSDTWPIHISRVLPWPEDWQPTGPDWTSRIKSNDANEFTAYTLQERDSIVFSGTSQWHYRERINQRQKNNFCHCVLFHYIPQGTRDLIDQERWAEYFGIPALDSVIVRGDKNWLNKKQIEL